VRTAISVAGNAKNARRLHIAVYFTLLKWSAIVIALLVDVTPRARGRFVMRIE
jgi:hypothetical protein